MNKQAEITQNPLDFWSVVTLSFKELIQSKVFVFIAGGFGSLTGLLTFWTNHFNWTLIDSVSFAVAVIFIIFLLKFLFCFFRNKKIYDKFKLNELINEKVDISLKEYLSKELKENLKENVEKNFHGDAIIGLSKAFSGIHWLERKLPELSSTELLDTMTNLCDELQKIFHNKKDLLCSVSIKVIRPNDEGIVENFCRDRKIKGRDTIQYINTKHVIGKNTGYHIICQNLLTNTSTFYLNNDIPNSPDYMNTSMDCYNEGVLPYKSELIVPIIPLVKKETDNFPLRGFLCVDCKEQNNFDKKYDVPTLQGVADGIYELFRNLFSKT